MKKDDLISLTVPKLLKVLEDANIEAHHQKETDQIVILFKIQGGEFPLFLKVFDEQTLLQLLVFIPAEIQKELYPDLAQLLHFLNHQLDLPGFGYDETANMTFYRLVLPRPSKTIENDLLIHLVKSIKKICELFAPMIVALLMKKTTYQEVREEIAKQEKKVQKGA